MASSLTLTTAYYYVQKSNIDSDGSYLSLHDKRSKCSAYDRAIGKGDSRVAKPVSKERAAWTD